MFGVRIRKNQQVRFYPRIGKDNRGEKYKVVHVRCLKPMYKTGQTMVWPQEEGIGAWHPGAVQVLGQKYYDCPIGASPFAQSGEWHE